MAAVHHAWNRTRKMQILQILLLNLSHTVSTAQLSTGGGNKNQKEKQADAHQR